MNQRSDSSSPAAPSETLECQVLAPAPFHLTSFRVSGKGEEVGFLTADPREKFQVGPAPSFAVARHHQVWPDRPAAQAYCELTEQRRTC